MKKVVFFVMLSTVLFSTSLKAWGKVWSEVDENNVARVHHDSAYFNCCAKMSFSKEIDEFMINIYEDDTTDSRCYCTCYYNFTHTFIGLKPGTYYVYVWERPNGDKFSFAGSTSFIIKDKNEDYSSYSEKTDCLKGVKNNAKENIISLEFPNIIEEKSTGVISFLVSGQDEMTLSIYNMAGIEIKRFTNIKNNSNIRWNLRNRRGIKIGKGIYFVKLQKTEIIIVKPLIVIE